MLTTPLQSLPGLIFHCCIDKVIADMLMMALLSIESSLGLAESPEDQHYYCRPEKNWPEARPLRLPNERTALLEEERHLRDHCFQNTTEMPAVKVLTRLGASVDNVMTPLWLPDSRHSHLSNMLAPPAVVRVTKHKMASRLKQNSGGYLADLRRCWPLGVTITALPIYPAICKLHRDMSMIL